MTVVVALPLLRSTAGATFPNETAPGPWCLNQVSTTGTSVRPSLLILLDALPSSLAHTDSSSGRPTTALRGRPMTAPGPLPPALAGSNFKTGGVLPVSASPFSASTSQLGL